MQWLTLFNKEILEASRNFKWIWVPLVFILLSISDPLSTYYLPQILEATGGLPEGSRFDIPVPQAIEVFQMSIGQLNTIGVLVTALISMRTIAGERKSGVAELILVKPVQHLSYITAKWAAAFSIVFVSVTAGLLASWYYVNLLFGDVPFTSLVMAIFFYNLWMAFILAISLFMNTLTKSPGVVLFFTMTSIIVLTIVSNILSHLLEWSPALLSTHIGTYLIEKQIPDALWGSVFITSIMIFLLLIGATYLLKKREIAY